MYTLSSTVFPDSQKLETLGGPKVWCNEAVWGALNDWLFYDV
uniref:Uncharacterized protein n=1 Tax=Anguilla anguilla TaxID=7936 RepID=A0A0E9R9G4_ANGAN